ncbi:LysR family transcriptional regulator [Methylobacterium sp. GXS13]|jgi:DNA-binding transcriptional LysR family regulator|uniref:LysR family transcriptional regulator n=1 Tax=Methylobacterium sp. GXS13 TaxID=1730094 RepID=UPI00071BCB70|nr:LysR family transcriptional regulator [Methylobacterium sp. GXS13]KST57336.1 LysR family transcriptional regulator [Methylobacterium sp. GXS13]
MPDLSLLPALDALLTEASVVRAARKIGLSPSAMSRTLDRLRTTTGDPLLVRAGRGLVLTPRAEALRDRVHRATHDIVSLLQPDGETLDLGSLARTFAIRANDGFVEVAGARLVAIARAAAPGVRLHFVPKFDKDARLLREGAVDLEIGVLGASGPEIRVQALFRDRFVGVVRRDHPLLEVPITPESYGACEHVAASRRGVRSGPVDDALARLGLSREVIVVVPSFAAALAVAAGSDLVALLPQSFVVARAAASLAPPFAMFELPLSLAGITVSQMWHPRLDADASHRWLRGLVLNATSTSSKAAEP